MAITVTPDIVSGNATFSPSGGTVTRVFQVGGLTGLLVADPFGFNGAYAIVSAAVAAGLPEPYKQHPFLTDYVVHRYAVQTEGKSDDTVSVYVYYESINVNTPKVGTTGLWFVQDDSTVNQISVGFMQGGQTQFGFPLTPFDATSVQQIGVNWSVLLNATTLASSNRQTVKRFYPKKIPFYVPRQILRIDGWIDDTSLNSPIGSLKVPVTGQHMLRCVNEETFYAYPPGFWLCTRAQISARPIMNITFGTITPVSVNNLFGKALYRCSFQFESLVYRHWGHLIYLESLGGGPPPVGVGSKNWKQVQDGTETPNYQDTIDLMSLPYTFGVQSRDSGVSMICAQPTCKFNNFFKI